MPSSKSNGSPLITDVVEHIRKRPGMYIGSVDQLGLHHLFHIALDNPIFQALNGTCRNITVVIENGERLTVSDDGGGLPLTSIQNHNAPFMELAFTIFVPPSYDPLNQPDQLLATNIISGQGYVTLNALCSELVVENRHEGLLWRQRHRKGKVFSPPSILRALQHDETDGLTITFTPDFDIFEDVQFDYDTLAKRCKHLAAFIQGLRINLIDERIGQYQSDTFYAEDGLASLVTEMGKGKNVVSPIISGMADAPLSMGVRYDQAGNELEEIVRFRAEFAIQFTHSSEETVSSFCNTISTPEHGTHVEGLRQGIKDFLRAHSGDKAINNSQLSYVGVISVFHPEPLYEGRVKLKILGSEILSAVRELVRNTLHQQLNDAHDVIQQIMLTFD